MSNTSEEKRKVTDQSTGQIVGFSILGLLFLLAFSYLELVGWMYMTMGNALVSMLLMGSLAVVIFLSAFLMPRIWSSDNKFVSKRRSLLMTIDIVVFTIAMLVAFIGVNHFARVYNDREEIEQLYNDGIEEARNLYPTYDHYVSDRCSSYHAILLDAMQQKNSKAQDYQMVLGRFPGGSDELRMRNLENSLRRTLQPTNDNLQSDFNEWLDQAGNANLWNISFSSNVMAMDRKISTCINALKDLSGQFFHPGESTQAFDYPQFASNAKLQSLLSKRELYISWKPIVIMLITALALVLPVFSIGLRSRKDI